MKNFKLIISITLLISGMTKLQAQNNYLNYDGINDYVQLDDNPIYDFSGDFTIEAKIKRDAVNGRGDIFVKKDLNSIPQSSNAIALFIGNDNKVYFWLRETTSSTPVSISSTTVTNASNWMHITGVRIGNTINLYIDGALESSNTFSDDLTSNGPIRIGSNRSESLTPNSAPSFPFDGNIDEVRIWNVSRTVTEIQTNMNSELTGNETGLIGYYDFNQGLPCANNISETTLTDNSLNTNNGTLFNFDLTANLLDSCQSNWNGDLPNSISEQENIKYINLYPNPVSNKLTIDTELNIRKITIVDITGKTIKTITSDFNTVDVSNLTNSIYFIKILDKEGSITKKFVKQ